MTRRQKAFLGIALAMIVGLLMARYHLSRTASIQTATVSADEALSQIYGGRDEADVFEGSAPGVEDAVLREGQFGGQVVFPNGEPAAGALIRAIPDDGADPMELNADSGGMFAFSEVGEALYLLEASLPDYGPATTFGVRAGQSGIRLVLQAGHTLEGLVLNRGIPVPHAAVHIAGGFMLDPRVTLADASGRFVFAGLRPGHYDLIAVGRQAGSGFGNRVVIDPELEGPLRFDLEVQPTATTRLELVDRRTGDPIVTGFVSLFEKQLTPLSLSAPAYGGVLDVDYLPRGEVFGFIQAPGYLNYEGPIRISGSGATVRIPMSPGATVRGRTLDQVGNPLANVQLTAWVTTVDGARWELRQAPFDRSTPRAQPDGELFWPRAPAYRSGSDGSFTLSGLPTGEAIFVASSPGWATTESNTISLREGDDYGPMELRLTRGRRVRGRVEDDSGGGLSGVVVSARSPGVPAWVSLTATNTSSAGGFELEDLPARTVLSVWHPDFSVAELQLEIPEAGLDDVVIRLSGTRYTSVRGRVFTQRGAPAVGALVWLMAGNSELPVCQATAGSDAWFDASHCTSTPDRIVISYAGHAPLVAELGSMEPRDWNLGTGGEIAVLSRSNSVVATVEPQFRLPVVHWPRPQMSLEPWERVLVPTVAPGNYVVRCEADGFDESRVQVTVTNGRRVEAPCPNLSRMVELTLAIVDPQGAPVTGAIVFVDRVSPPFRGVTDARGRVRIRTRPGVWLDAEAFHEHWGRGTLRFYAHYQEPTDPDRIVLDTSVAGANPAAFVASFADWGVDVVVDGKSAIVQGIQQGTPAAGGGIRRLDRILWGRPIGDFRFAIGLRRDGELLTFELIREPNVP